MGCIHITNVFANSMSKEICSQENQEEYVSDSSESKDRSDKSVADNEEDVKTKSGVKQSKRVFKTKKPKTEATRLTNAHSKLVTL